MRQLLAYCALSLCLPALYPLMVNAQSLEQHENFDQAKPGALPAGWESGVTAQWFGLVPSVVAGGIGTLLVVGIVALIWPRVRRFGSLGESAIHAEADKPTG